MDLAMGSSPRMRGSQVGQVLPSWEAGIIPAHAGLTADTLPAPSAAQDHPRACGAHMHCLLLSVLLPGSSPRMRGSLFSRCGFRAALGIIPAHAGLTLCVLQIHAGNRDHPRACGAHYLRLSIQYAMLGSSPRMRGSLDHPRADAAVGGIIPAHAGLTLVRWQCQSPTWDHPRACGAHDLYALLDGSVLGSSPRMRGSLSGRAGGSAPEGIIPAHAGLTKTPGSTSFTSRDHPRACGAHSTRQYDNDSI